jgi:hypothetical protein
MAGCSMSFYYSKFIGRFKMNLKESTKQSGAFCAEKMRYEIYRF